MVAVDDVLACALEEYIANNHDMITIDNIMTCRAKDIKTGALDEMKCAIDNENSIRSKGEKLKLPNALKENHVSRILYETGDFVCIVSADGKCRRLAMRQRCGEFEGIYRLQDEKRAYELNQVIYRLNADANERFCSNVLYNLTSICDCVKQTADGVHIPCKNGIFDLDTMTFTAWGDPNYDTLYGDYVFLKKLKINYNPNATNVVIHNPDDGTDWSVDYQINSCLDDDASRQLVWELYNFLFRGISGGKTVWFLNSSGQAGGGGGKTTITTLGKNVIGEENILVSAAEELGKDFNLYYLPEKIAIIGHESDSNTTKIEKSSIYKNLSRKQPVFCNGKNKQPFSYRFEGQLLFEINGIPRFLDKSTAVHRKDLIIHFEKSFDNGSPRDYIVDEYVYREDVLEYVLFKALSLGAIKQFSADCVDVLKDNLKEVKEAGSDVFAMMNEFADTFEMDTVPVALLFDLYKAWMVEENGARYNLTLRNFKTDLMVWCKDSPEWEFVKGSVRMSRTSGKEFVIAEYGYAMNGWQKARCCTSVDINVGGHISSEKLNKVYTDGIRRTTEGERIRAVEKAKKMDDDTLKYKLFRGEWFEVYAQELISGRLKDEDVPPMEMWLDFGRPEYNAKTGKFESDELDCAYTNYFYNVRRGND